jgi:hypothetical protein
VGFVVDANGVIMLMGGSWGSDCPGDRHTPQLLALRPRKMDESSDKVEVSDIPRNDV